ncbi:MAG TPA: hypothetical protein VFE53_06405 [Mucilaginibacter sp.]|jgi:hypothetical protein|nr:hypothetical protein [Mucilaginibacter sp.]
MDRKERSDDFNRGRPTDYTPELASLICDRIATHEIGLKRLCAKYDDLPDKVTIYRWINKYPDFRNQYALAKIKQIDVLIDEIVDISDNTQGDEKVSENGEVSCNSEFIARSRLRVDTRKWLASKLVPKLYGDRSVVDNTHTIKHEDSIKDLA